MGSPEEIVKADMSYYGVMGTIGRTIRDKVLGVIGVTYLVVGFFLQAVAYVLTVAGVSEAGRGGCQALIVAGLGIGTIALTLGFARFLYPQLVKIEGRKAARVVLFMVGDKKVGARTDPLPYPERLEEIGRFLDYPDRAEGESGRDYALRVWGVDRLATRPYPKSS